MLWKKSINEMIFKIAVYQDSLLILGMNIARRDQHKKKYYR